MTLLPNSQPTPRATAARRLQETAMTLSRWKSLALVAAIATTSMASQCFSITDPFVVSVNVQNVTGTYNVTPGTVNFDPSCRTEDPSSYLDANYDVVSGARLVDVTVQTIGAFAGSVNGGQVRVNGVTLVSYNGSWNAFNTAQSLLQNNTLLTRNTAGVNTLLSAINAQQPIIICHAGAFSQAAPAGLSIEVKVFAQVDATP